MLLALFSIEKTKPKEKPYKLSDGNGLYLLVKPNGAKLWRFRFNFAGKQNMMSLGSFPEVSLATARKKRDEARQLRGRIDPPRQKKLNKLAANAAARNTLGAVTAKYLEKTESGGRDSFDH